MTTEKTEQIGDLDRQILELQEKRRGMVDVSAPKDIEVTAVIAVYNAWMWLGRTLFCLELGAQSIPLDVVLCDNSSTDPCKDILPGPGFANWIESRKGRLNEVEVLASVPQMMEDEGGTPDNPVRKPFKNAKQRGARNYDFMLTKLTRHVKTPYILYVDSDVGMPSGAVGAMLQEMKANENLAMLGIRYDQEVNLDHVQMGCTMARTDLMKSVVGQFDSREKGCPCRDATRKLVEGGYDVKYLDGWVARHFKKEMP